MPNTFNLYFLTNHLVNDKDECEIEDLFDDDVLNVEINGKKFSKKEENSDKTYGKAVFANYVMQNYMEIDFSNFDILLGNINSIVEGYKNSHNFNQVI